MNLTNIKKQYIDEIQQAFKQSCRFNVECRVYDPHTKKDIRNPNIRCALYHLMKTIDEISIYRFEGNDVEMLEASPIVKKKRGKYSVSGSSITETHFNEILLQQDDGGPLRGSILFCCDANDTLLLDFIKECYDPGYLTGLKYYMSASALNAAKRNQANNKDKVTVIIDYYGLNKVSFFSSNESITTLFNYACDNAIKSEQFKYYFMDVV